MTGTFPPNVQAGIAKVSGTDGPPSTNQQAPAAAAGGAQGQEAVSYTAQTGLIKYAPMVTPPGTKITKKAPTPRYPTSSVPIAQTFLPTPKQTTTMTASATYAPARSRPFQDSILEGNYPAKAHCAKVASYLQTKSANAAGKAVIYLEGQKTILIEDNDEPRPFRYLLS
ncbi:MAG: hypothetical protein Q9199_005286 [Rusavskia elegans]